MEEKEKEVVYICGGSQIMGSLEVWEYTLGWPSLKGEETLLLHGFSQVLGTPLRGVPSTKPTHTRTSLIKLICFGPNLVGAT
jgi:hypothetical protein